MGLAAGRTALAPALDARERTTATSHRQRRKPEQHGAAGRPRSPGGAVPFPRLGSAQRFRAALEL